jgi:uncharacterized protein
MPSALSYPGVYVEEISSGVRPIAGVATSITAFIGRATRGPTNEPTRISNFGDFERKFGRIDYHCPMGYSVQQFFLNGGIDAIIVRVANVGTNGDAVKANNDIKGLKLQAKGEGQWGNHIRIRIFGETRPSTNQNDVLFNLFVLDKETGASESFRNLSLLPENPRYFKVVLAEESALIEFPKDESPNSVPSNHDPLASPFDDPFDDNKADSYFTSLANGNDGTDIDVNDVLGERGSKTGLYSLEKADLFNLLCIPPLSRTTDFPLESFEDAAKYCVERRAMLIVDPPSDTNSIDVAEKQLTTIMNSSETKKNSAVFFPRVKMQDEKQENRLKEFAPSGAVAGVMSRTDLTRGVWKTPAGQEAGLVGVRAFTVPMTDRENGRLNILGINCLRSFPVIGNVVWGGRTLDGADQLASEWKYLAVRRFTLFLEESLYRGTKWVVFEPNDEPLWAQIRLNVGAFMQNLFRQGAFQGRSPREAYFVRCGSDTTNQTDINRGIVNIEVGFAPLKPAEFVILKFQQITGKIDT